MITIKNLMSLERILLEINVKHKFELSFNSAYKLYKHLIEIGRVTNYSFQVQDEFSQIAKDKDEMKSFHEKIINDEVEYDWENTVSFIDELMEELKNNEVNEMVNKLKFW